MANEKLKQVWMDTVAPFTREGETEWERISGKYEGKGRYYHTLEHLSAMYDLLKEYYGNEVPVATLLALFYHDFEYSPLRSDNEARSAQYAKARLREWNADAFLIERVVRLINETKHHSHIGNDNELKIFLDADMAILGTYERTYGMYRAGVRLEYKLFPDVLYNTGRRDFVKKTLSVDNIYHTDFFRKRFEKQARFNLQSELNQLL